jgi:hypothetical protein
MMAMIRVELSNEAIIKLDRIAHARAIDTELLADVGLAPADMLHFAEETGDVPSIGQVRRLIRRMGPAPELDRLLDMARRRDEMDRKERREAVSFADVLQTLVTTAGFIMTLWTKLVPVGSGPRVRGRTAIFEQAEGPAEAEPAVAAEKSRSEV